MASFWEYFSVLAPSVGLGLIFWLVMRSLFRADSGERNARAELEEREAREWARLRPEQAGPPSGAAADPRGAGRPGERPEERPADGSGGEPAEDPGGPASTRRDDAAH